MPTPNEEPVWSYGLSLPFETDREDFAAYMNHLANTLEQTAPSDIRSIVIYQEWDDSEKLNKEGYSEMPWTATVNQTPPWETLS